VVDDMKAEEVGEEELIDVVLIEAEVGDTVWNDGTIVLTDDVCGKSTDINGKRNF
jgi:hypothetical protein